MVRKRMLESSVPSYYMLTGEEFVISASRGRIAEVPRALFLGSYPPRECGIATFTKDVVDSYDERFGGRNEIIAIEEPGAPARDYPPTVVATLVQNDRESYRAIAGFVNEHSSDALNVQHEYGLFGGE